MDLDSGLWYSPPNASERTKHSLRSDSLFLLWFLWLNYLSHEMADVGGLAFSCKMGNFCSITVLGKVP